MKLPITLLLTVFVMTTSAWSQETTSLWPEGKMPFPNSEDQEDVFPILNLYPTQNAESHTRAAVVVCPGGGYGGLAKDHEGHQIAEWYNERGVSAFVLHYRLGSQGYHYPAELADVQRAIRWVRSNAESYDIDPERIAVMGFSAGGHLASMAATLFDREVYDGVDEIDGASARPDLAVLCYPVISMDSEITHGGSRKNLLGPDKYQDEDLAVSVSSEKNVTSNTPPTFLFQTDEDSAVPAENAVRFYLALRENGVPAEMHIYEKGPHGVGLYGGDPVLGTWSGLLDNWLRSRSFYSGPASQASVSGEVKLDGLPVSWGVLTFYPEESSFPIVSVRVRRGKFSSPESTGPVVGASKLRFEGSIWEETEDAEDKIVQLDSLKPGGEPLLVEVKPGMSPLRFEFSSK